MIGKQSSALNALFHLGAFLAMTAWGASFVSTKVLLDNGLHPAEIYIYRFLLAYLLILTVCHKQIFSNSWRDELLFATCGLCAGSIYFIAENTALEYTLATNVSLITSLSPILTTMIIGFLYKSERPGRGFITGSFLAFMGVGLVIFNSSFVIKVNPIGDMLSLLAAVSWAIYSVVLRRLNTTYTVMFISRKTFFYGVLTALPFLAISPDLAPMETLTRPAVWGNLLFLGLFASMFAYVIWAQAIKVLGPVKASNYLYFQPIITLIASAWFLGETISFIGYAGCTLIIVGVWLSEWLERRKIVKRS
ncbi:MAG: DMT family transporter [Muribaculaceae bacterium]|nr:DMT family transporter [Muribaculaceae bacterium]